jgi:hypothetical protein
VEVRFLGFLGRVWNKPGMGNLELIQVNNIVWMEFVHHGGCIFQVAEKGARLPNRFFPHHLTSSTLP